MSFASENHLLKSVMFGPLCDGSGGSLSALMEGQGPLSVRRNDKNVSAVLSFYEQKLYGMARTSSELGKSKASIISRCLLASVVVCERLT